MPTTTINGRDVAVDEEGFMTEYDQWDEDMGTALASAIGVDMTDDHWKVVNYLRDEYREHGHTPNFRNMLKGMAAVMPGCDSKALYDLFPVGPAKQGAKVAGLPQPLGKGGY